MWDFPCHFFYLFIFLVLRAYVVVPKSYPHSLPPHREKLVSNWHLFMEFAPAREKFLLAWKKPIESVSHPSF